MKQTSTGSQYGRVMYEEAARQGGLIARLCDHRLPLGEYPRCVMSLADNMPYRQNRLIVMLTEGKLVRVGEGEHEGRGFRGSPRTSRWALDAPDDWPGLICYRTSPSNSPIPGGLGPPASFSIAIMSG